MSTARPNGRRHRPAPAAAFDVVTLAGARGAALWRWWLDAPREGHAAPMALHAEAPGAPTRPVTVEPEPAFTLITLGADQPATAGIVLDL